MFAEDFTITKKAPTRAFSWLKVPTSANAKIIRDRRDGFLKLPFPYDNYFGIPISILLTVFRTLFSIVCSSRQGTWYRISRV